MWRRTQTRADDVTQPGSGPATPSPRELELEATRHARLAQSLEDLFDQVWRCEKEWKLDERIGLAWRQRAQR
ncbi:MAG: hypothetical protein J2P45_09065 [Candidatus Dormibacteraeota bacterium]|nr:hypothetical protein [Candidatus Dormibacteraeota bacterium]